MKLNKWFYLISLSVIWGSSFILIKKGLIGLEASQLGSLRIIFSSLANFGLKVFGDSWEANHSSLHVTGQKF